MRGQTEKDEDQAFADPAPAVPQKPRTRLGDLLIAKQMVTPGQVGEALLQQSASGKRLGVLLMELGAISEKDLARTLADQLGMELVDLSTQIPDEEALAKIPEVVARNLMALPIRMKDGRLQVAVTDPADREALEKLTVAAGMDITPVVAPPTDIRLTIDRSYRAIADVSRHVEAFQLTSTTRRGEEELRQAVVENAPVVQVVNLAVTQAIRDRASDVHIEPQEALVRVRFRIDGALHDVVALPTNMASALISRVKVMAGMNIVERQRPQDGQFSLMVDDRDINIRVSTTATIWGEKAVLRLLDKSRSLYRLSDLGMPADTFEQYEKVIRSPFGMLLCAGPTGCGKTTTLYATLGEINKADRNIMTIEDPVEYVLTNINQIQIKEAAGITFATGLRSILRQDPDIILVGEIRDAETARIAAQSALTGHFVLSSLHATDAITALQRFIDMGIEPFVLASSVQAVVGQRLVRRICSHCKERYAPSGEEMIFYLNSGGDTSKLKFWRGAGCNFCAHTGFQDRIGIYELLRITDATKQLIVARASREEFLLLGKEQGMRTLRTEALRLVTEDVTTIAEVLRAIYVL